MTPPTIAPVREALDVDAPETGRTVGLDEGVDELEPGLVVDAAVVLVPVEETEMEEEEGEVASRQERSVPLVTWNEDDSVWTVPPPTTARNV